MKNDKQRLFTMWFRQVN